MITIESDSSWTGHTRRRRRRRRPKRQRRPRPSHRRRRRRNCFANGVTTNVLVFLVSVALFAAFSIDSRTVGCHAHPPCHVHLLHTAEKKFVFSSNRAFALAFSSSGFGGRKVSSSFSSAANKKKTRNKLDKKKGGDKRKGKRAPLSREADAATTPGVSAASATDLLSTPVGRMSYIRSRIELADISPMSSLALRKNSATGALTLDVDPNAICVVDNFLGPNLIRSMRSEAEGLLHTMIPSQSTRWDEATQSIVPYDKVGVLSTQIEGGTAGYAASPRLVEYVATLAAELGRCLNEILPDAHRLDTAMQTNKLAVCMGGGSKYDKHIDNLGGDGTKRDWRKLTALLYLQPTDSHPPTPTYPDESEVGDEKGGYFRAYDVPNDGNVLSIAPKGDRLLLFWSDALVHDVSPSYAPGGKDDWRWALTVWLLADEKTGIIRPSDAAIEKRHFGSG